MMTFVHRHAAVFALLASMTILVVGHINNNFSPTSGETSFLK